MRRFGMAAVAAMAVLAVKAGQGDGRFYLTDQRTQVPVMSCAIPPNWMAGGKTTWTTEPSQPVHWYAWTVSPDQQIKIILSSQAVLAVNGRIRQAPFLRDPNVLANAFLAAVQRDHCLSNARVAEARFNPMQPGQDLINSRMRQARERGIRPTDFYSTELFVRYEGYRGGEVVSACLSLPMLAMENRPGMGFVGVVEVLLPTSFSAPANQLGTARQVLQGMIGSFRLNPAYIAMVNRITEQRVANWIRVQNEIHDQQMAAAASASKTQDKVRNMWSEYIRDVDTVSNPNTGEKMFVDSRYDHAWINNDNEVIYHNSDNASFNPNENRFFNQTNWRKLK